MSQGGEDAVKEVRPTGPNGTRGAGGGNGAGREEMQGAGSNGEGHPTDGEGSDLEAYLDGLTKLQAGRARKVLETKVRYDDGVRTRAEQMKRLVERGATFTIYWEKGRNGYAYGFMGEKAQTLITKSEFDFAKSVGGKVVDTTAEDKERERYYELASRYEFPDDKSLQRKLDFAKRKAAAFNNAAAKKELADLEEYEALREKRRSMDGEKAPKNEAKDGKETTKDGGGNGAGLVFRGNEQPHKLSFVDDEDQARAKELIRQLRVKLYGELHAGFDPEIFSLGAELSALVIKHGVRKMSDFAHELIKEMGMRCGLTSNHSTTVRDAWWNRNTRSGLAR